MSFQMVGVIGAGTMGSGIATSLAQQGVSVRLVDSSDEVVARGKAAANKFYSRAVEKGKLSAEDAEAMLGRIATSTELSSLEGCDLIIEAIFEEQSVKETLFAQLNPFLSADTVVATNTSALQVSDLAKAIDDPTRFLGLHYFNPAAINPIVEVVKGEQTDTALYEKALQFCRDTAKTPIACKDRFGFAINRFFVPYANEAIRLLDEGLGTTAQIDRVAKDVLGVAAGPFVVMNLVKPKIMFHAQRNLGPHGPFYGLAASLAEKGDTDYEFDVGADDAGEASADKIIADRLMAGVFFPILQEIDEEVATPADIDLGAALALRFGKEPCALMDSLGKEEVSRIVGLITETYGHTAPASLERVGTLRS